MATRTIETDNAGIKQVHFVPDNSCDNLDCNCDDSDLPVTITTTAVINGDTHTDFELQFCSLDCVYPFLGERFPLIDSPDRTVTPNPSIRIFEPEL